MMRPTGSSTGPIILDQYLDSMLREIPVYHLTPTVAELVELSIPEDVFANLL